MTSNEGNNVSRRGFIDWLLGSSIGGFALLVAYPVFRYWIPPELPESAVNSVTVPFPASEMGPNQGRIFKFGSKPAMLVRTPEGEFKAFSARCTHLDCTVQFKTDTEQVWCACHNGIYDIEGRNISGPPPKPLERFEVVIKGDKIFVRRGEAA